MTDYTSSIHVPAELLDAAFAQAKEQSSLSNDVQTARQQLSLTLLQYSRSQVARAYAQAQRLVGACYDIGDACRAEQMTREQAEALLAQRLPGFSPEVYNQAVSYGLFISR